MEPRVRRIGMSRRRRTLFRTLRGHKISSVLHNRDSSQKIVLSSNIQAYSVDNLVGVAVLRRDPVVGQCVSYYKLMVDFRQDHGTHTLHESLSNDQKTPSV